MCADRKSLKSIKQELAQIKNELLGTKDPAERMQLKWRRKRAQQAIFQLKRELRASREGRTGDPVTGALPDFCIIGAMKCGTSSLYYLLTRHPLVEPAASKELHFFDNNFDLGAEWYRRCFPAPRWKDGQRTITGEGAPYLADPLAPRRMAGVVPQARLIVLLRNPVDRAYSHYHYAVSNSRETQTFEEAISKAIQRGVAWPLDEAQAAEHDVYRADLGGIRRYGYVSKGFYVDQLLNWAKFFSREQMLVLKSEDFFESPKETLKVVLDFLDLPEWELEDWEIRKKGSYEGEINPATRRRLEEYFEPHNRRLYDYLGTDFGW